MKKILLIALFLSPLLGFSQTTKPIDGFLGIKFGSSRLAVIAAIKAKGGIIDKVNTNAKSIQFTNVKLGHRMSDAFAVRFLNNKAYFAIFVFKPDADPRTIDYYNDLVSDISEIYGPGKPTKIYRTTFTDGDGYEITALQTGNADYYTDWVSANNTSMQASITDKLNVLLIYQDDTLYATAAAQQKAKEKSDY